MGPKLVETGCKQIEDCARASYRGLVFDFVSMKSRKGDNELMEERCWVRLEGELKAKKARNEEGQVADPQKERMGRSPWLETLFPVAILEAV
jgi:hypothetical protein